jgi:hypothetical protein
MRRGFAGLIAVCVLATGVTVLAGARKSVEVVVSRMPLYASGALGAARNSSDTFQYIGCMTMFPDEPGEVLGMCWAADKLGKVGYCDTTDADKISAIRSIDESSFIEFSWSGSPGSSSGPCLEIAVQHFSYYAPKQP